MIVELIGSTGAGKSSVAERLQLLLAARRKTVLLSDQFVLQCYGLRLGWFRSRVVRSLLVDVLSFPWFVYFAVRRPSFCWFVAATVYRGVELPLFSLNVVRNIVKQMGVYELLRVGASAADVILLDEGLVHQAHSLFVHPAMAPSACEIEHFVREVPLPDLLVLVEAPAEDVIQRTLARGHPRVRGRSVSTIAPFVHHAQWVFDEVARLAAQRTALEMVANAGTGTASIDASLQGLVSDMLTMLKRDTPKPVVMRSRTGG